MIAEYERAQIMERTRRGKNQRARSGSVNVLSGAPFGYRYVRKGDHAAARYEVVPHEAAIVAGLFRRYADEGIAIAELARWLGSTGVATRTGKARWDRSTIWGMLRNPAYAGRACFGKTGRVSQQAGRNRVARLARRAAGAAYTTVDRPRGDWLEIDVPALVDEATFERVARRLAGNKKFASRASKTPSLLQGLAACSGCGYACYRGHTTTTAGNKIFYYRCIGSGNYRFEHGKVCGSKPVRADYLDQVVWDHITDLIADPALIRAEITGRLAQIRTADPATAQRKRLDDALAKTTSAVSRLIGAYQEDLLSLDELRARMPDLRARETSLRHQAQALDAQLADREVYLKLAQNLERFLAALRKSAVSATVEDRQRVVRLLVKEVLVGPGKIVIRHSIPTRGDTPAPASVSTDSDDDAEPAPSSHLRWRSHGSAVRERDREGLDAGFCGREPVHPAFQHVRSRIDRPHDDGENREQRPAGENEGAAAGGQAGEERDRERDGHHERVQAAHVTVVNEAGLACRVSQRQDEEHRQQSGCDFERHRRHGRGGRAGFASARWPVCPDSG